jgi:hypothetical protein
MNKSVMKIKLTDNIFILLTEYEIFTKPGVYALYHNDMSASLASACRIIVLDKSERKDFGCDGYYFFKDTSQTQHIIHNKRIYDGNIRFIKTNEKAEISFITSSVV